MVISLLFNNENINETKMKGTFRDRDITVFTHLYKPLLSNCTISEFPNSESPKLNEACQIPLSNVTMEQWLSSMIFSPKEHYVKHLGLLQLRSVVVIYWRDSRPFSWGSELGSHRVNCVEVGKLVTLLESDFTLCLLLSKLFG